MCITPVKFALDFSFDSQENSMVARVWSVRESISDLRFSAGAGKRSPEAPTSPPS